MKGNFLVRGAEPGGWGRAEGEKVIVEEGDADVLESRKENKKKETTTTKRRTNGRGRKVKNHSRIPQAPLTPSISIRWGELITHGAELHGWRSEREGPLRVCGGMYCLPGGFFAATQGSLHCSRVFWILTGQPTSFFCFLGGTKSEQWSSCLAFLLIQLLPPVTWAGRTSFPCGGRQTERRVGLPLHRQLFLHG